MTITVIGAGWLGLSLVQALVANGHGVIGTCRSEEKATLLRRDGLSAVAFTLGSAIPEAVLQADTWVVNLPPGRRSNDLSAFHQHLDAMIRAGFAAGLQHLVFISTTSVYAGLSGVVEDTGITAPTTASGKLHVAIEQLLQSEFSGRGTVLRLAGLVGGQRHPINSLAGRSLDKGQHPVNLVHRDDVTAAITRVIERDMWGLTLHLCSLDHPSRQDYYSWCATTKDLPLPLFTRDHSPGKTIAAEAAWSALGISPRFPSPFDML